MDTETVWILAYSFGGVIAVALIQLVRYWWNKKPEEVKQSPLDRLIKAIEEAPMEKLVYYDGKLNIRLSSTVRVEDGPLWVNGTKYISPIPTEDYHRIKAAFEKKSKAWIDDLYQKAVDSIEQTKQKQEQSVVFGINSTSDDGPMVVFH